MKSSIYALIATLALTQVTASAIPTSSSDFHIIQDSPLGPIYSNAAPKSRRSDSKTYLVGGDANHPVYSNIDPAERAKVESSHAETSKRTAESQPELVEKREVTEASIDEWVGKHPDSGYSAEKMKEYLRTHPDAMAESSHELPPKDLVVAPEQESGGLIEKRDWELCVACHGVCVLAYADLRNWIRILSQCTSLCYAQAACTRTENLDYYRIHQNDH